MEKKMKIWHLGILFGLFALHGGETVLENKHAALVFDSEYGYGLKKIVNKQTGRTVEFTPPDAGKDSLWAMIPLEHGEELPELLGYGEVKIDRRQIPSGQVLIMHWEKLKAGSGSVTVEVTVTLPDDSGIADWHLRLKCDGNPAPWVKSVTFPRVNGIRSLGDDYLIYGEHLGRMVRDPGRRLRGISIGNPGDWSMQFAAFYGSAQLAANSLVKLSGEFRVNGFQRGPANDETGLFLAADDGEGYQKYLRMRGRPAKRDFSIYPVHYPPLPFWPMDSEKPGVEFVYEIPYAMKLGTYSGGAGAAAEIYRELVKDRKWMANGPLRAPGNPVSPKIVEAAFWAKFYFGANKATPEVLRMCEYLRVPVNTLWYRYYVRRFNANEPEYFPSMPEYRNGVKILREAGVGVAPYVCCALWDPNTESFRRFGMEKAAAIDESGKPYSWALMGNRPSLWMHPASPLWRDKYRDITMKMFGQYGTDGQYLDVIAIIGKLCYNPGWHLPHGGNYWAEGNQRLLESLKENTAKAATKPFLTTEGFLENYIHQFDNFLMLDITRYGWKNRNGVDVFPLFSLVYHDYAINYGSDCGQTLNAEMLRWQMGLSFTWGIQLCWSDIKIDPPGERIHDLYTRELVHAWYRSGSKFLTGGRGIEIAQVPNTALAGKAAVTVISAPYGVKLSDATRISFPWDGPSVPGSAWRAFDGTVGLTLANITGRNQPIRVLFNREQLSGPFDTLWRTWPLPAEKLGKLSERTDWEFEVPSDRALILEVRDDSQPEIHPLLDLPYKSMLANASGDFPPLVRDTDEIYATDDVSALNDGGEVRLLSERTGKELKVSRMVNWQRLEGYGGPRFPENRTFYLLKPTGWRLKDGTAIARWNDGVISAQITVKTGGVLTVPQGVVAVLNHNGKWRLATGTVELSPGTWRLCGFKPELGWQKIDPQNIPGSLGEISSRAAAEGRKLLTGADTLLDIDRNRGETLLALGNAACFAATGKRAWLNNDHDWLLPGRTETFSYEGIRPGKIELLNSEHTGQVEIKWTEVTVRDVAAAANLLRFLYTTEKESEGVRFTATALNYLEVAEPLLTRISPANAFIVKPSGAGTITNHLSIINTAPIELPINLSADLSPGWSFPPELNNPFTLKAQEHKTVPLVFRYDGVDRGERHSLRVNVAYSSLAEAARHEDFEVVERRLNLKPFAADTSVEETAWSPVIRRQCLTAALVGTEGKVEISLRPSAVLSLKTTNVTWTLFDAKMKSLQSGKITFKNDDHTLSLPVSEPGLYFVRVAGRFFRAKILNRSGGFSGWEYEPFITCGKERNVLYFAVNPNAKEFEFCGTDGGPSEPCKVTIRNSDGEIVFERDGRYVGQWFRIPVATKQAGKLWSVEILPVEDFELRFRGPVSSWLSTSPGAALAD